MCIYIIDTHTSTYRVYMCMYVCMFVCLYVYTFHLHDSGLECQLCFIGYILNTGCQSFFPVLRPRAARRVHAGIPVTTSQKSRDFPAIKSTMGIPLSSMDGVKTFLVNCLTRAARRWRQRRRPTIQRPGRRPTCRGGFILWVWKWGTPWDTPKMANIFFGGENDGKTNGMNWTMFRQSHFLLKWPWLIWGKKLKAERDDVFRCLVPFLTNRCFMEWWLLGIQIFFGFRFFSVSLFLCCCLCLELRRVVQVNLACVKAEQFRCLALGWCWSCSPGCSSIADAWIVSTID